MIRKQGGSWRLKTAVSKEREKKSQQKELKEKAHDTSCRRCVYARRLTEVLFWLDFDYKRLYIKV